MASKMLHEIGIMENDIFSKRRSDELRQRKKQRDRCRSNAHQQFVGGRNSSQSMWTEQLNEFDEQEATRDSNDEVKLYEAGYKDRYYSSKFNVDVTNQTEYTNFRREICRHYARGMSWVLQYYYQGVPAWDWFYPYHYAPFAADFCNFIDDVSNNFPTDTSPFQPFEQLMAVFPEASGHFLPHSFHMLMKDPESPIIDFYPKTFKLDINGKRFDWQAVVLLPFVCEKRLFSALEPVRSLLTDEENMRNSKKQDLLFCCLNDEDPTSNFLLALSKQDQNGKWQKLPANCLAGKVRECSSAPALNTTLKSPLQLKSSDVLNVRSLCFEYKNPKYKSGYCFLPTLLENVKMPEKTLKPVDYDDVEPYRPVTGFTYRARMGSNGNSPLNRATRAFVSPYDKSQRNHFDRRQGNDQFYNWNNYYQDKNNNYQDKRSNRNHRNDQYGPYGRGADRYQRNYPYRRFR